MIEESELARIVDEIIELNIGLVKSKGALAHSILMGKVMQKVRGRRMENLSMKLSESDLKWPSNRKKLISECANQR